MPSFQAACFFRRVERQFTKPLEVLEVIQKQSFQKERLATPGLILGNK